MDNNTGNTLVNGGSTVIDVAPSGDQYGFPILNVQGHGSDAGEDSSTRAGYDTHYELVVTDSNAQQVDLATYGISFNSASGLIQWNPTDAQLGNYLFKVTLDDSHGSRVSESFNLTTSLALVEDQTETITLHSVEANPTFLASGISISVDGINFYSLTPSSPYYDSATGLYELNGPQGGSLDLSHLGDPTPVIKWTPTNADVTQQSTGLNLDQETDQRLPYIFKVVTQDGLDTETFDVVVKNTAPSLSVQEVDITAGHTTTTTLGDTTSVTLSSDNALVIDMTSEDANQNTTLTPAYDTYYTLQVAEGTGALHTVGSFGYEPNQPGILNFNGEPVAVSGGGTITFDSVNGVIHWTPDNQDAGDYKFEVKIYDGHGGTKTEDITVHVADVAPQWINQPTDYTLTEDGGTNPATYNSTNTATYTYSPTVGTDVSSLGVTYELSLDYNNNVYPFTPTDPFFSGVQLQLNNTDHHYHMSGYVNGPQGGLLDFDTLTGQIIWKTTNADVTVNGPGTVNADGTVNTVSVNTPYQFVLAATDLIPDGHGGLTDGNHASDSSIFNITVNNNPTQAYNLALLLHHTSGHRHLHPR